MLIVWWASYKRSCLWVYITLQKHTIYLIPLFTFLICNFPLIWIIRSWGLHRMKPWAWKSFPNVLLYMVEGMGWSVFYSIWHLQISFSFLLVVLIYAGRNFCNTVILLSSLLQYGEGWALKLICFIERNFH